MDKIPYFDAHCDTISRCVETGEDFTGEDREFYAVPCSLRRSEGHIDLERTERAFSRYAQFFAFYRDGRGLTQRQLLTACARQHERFLREMEENKDRIRLCRTKKLHISGFCFMKNIQNQQTYHDDKSYGKYQFIPSNEIVGLLRF